MSRLDASVLQLDYEAEAGRIAARMRALLAAPLHRRGLVVAVSGGIDSACTLALAVRAVGAARVVALVLPERDSSPDSAVRAQSLIAQLGVRSEQQDIAPVLAALGCYSQIDAAVAHALPQWRSDWKMKIVIAGGSEGRINHFRLVAEDPAGARFESRLDLRDYLQIVAATNFKQRVRKTLEYFHADRLNYAVAGTPNLLEYDQGFFVRNGDGAADVKPIAHLYKTQVYGLARHLGVPESICSAAPTTDTYGLPQGQDEFYFALPWQQMDLALWAINHGHDAAELAAALGISAERAAAVYEDIQAKRRATRALHLPPLLVAPADGPGHE